MLYLDNMLVLASLVTVSTKVFDLGGMVRTTFIVFVIAVEFYLLRKTIMATKEELAQAISDVTTSVAGEIERVTKKITELQNASADDGVSPADLDQPIAQLQALKTALDGVQVDTVTGDVSGTENIASGE